MTSADLHAAAPVRIRRLTWAGIQLAYADRTILIDPLLNPRDWQPNWIGDAVPIELTTPQVTVLMTHTHPDHFDPTGVRSALGDRAAFVCIASRATFVASHGLRTFGLQHYEPLQLGEWSVMPVPASDGNGEEQVSWVVRVAGRKFIHCGDTLWHGHWWKIGREYGPFDLAFLPINGATLLARQPYVDTPATMTPDQAAAAAAVLRARSVTPIHYGFDDPQRYREVPDALNSFRAAATRRGIEVRAVAPGEWLEVADWSAKRESHFRDVRRLSRLPTDLIDTFAGASS
jgi:L-ascorbate metabolism protein UlaG (beta-lactamase superfamily)